MANLLTEEQKQKWKETIQIQKQSGLSIERWCKENRVIASRFYYWKKRLFSDEVNSSHFSKFVELKDSNQCNLSIECQGVHLELKSGTLKQALRFLGALACS